MEVADFVFINSLLSPNSFSFGGIKSTFSPDSFLIFAFFENLTSNSLIKFSSGFPSKITATGAGSVNVNNRILPLAILNIFLFSTSFRPRRIQKFASMKCRSRTANFAVNSFSGLFSL
jgi:hypothetical protein